MADGIRHAAVVESLKATASELNASPEMNPDWADRMAENLSAAGLLAAADQDHDKPAGRAESPQVSNLAGEGRFTDLTARLAAADGGWCLTYGDERADPAYIRWLARHVDAFEDHASPAAPADDEAAVERMARATYENISKGIKFADPWDDYSESYREMYRSAARAALAALREGQ